MLSIHQHRTCGFSWPGTYNHECGNPATHGGIKETDTTKTGFYYAARCSECVKHSSRDNAGISTWETYDPAKSAKFNVWR